MQRYYFSLLLLMLAFSSCKPKTNSDLIVGTWKLNLPGEEKKISFYKDLTMTMVDKAARDNAAGTYKLVHDGKFLDTWQNGRSDTDELEIISINEATMQLKSTKDSRILVLTKDSVK